MSLLAKSVVGLVLLLLASVIFTRFYLPDSADYGGTYAITQPNSSSLSVQPGTVDEYSEILVEPEAISKPVEASAAKPVTISAMDETDIVQDEYLQERLAGALNIENRGGIYRFLDSPYAPHSLFANKRLSQTDAELLRPLLRVTFNETDSRAEQILARGTFIRFIKYLQNNTRNMLF